MSTPPNVPGYAVEGLLGSGGDAQVWLAVDQSSRQRVAVKQIRNLTSADRYRLHREAALQAGIVHPHVLRVLGIHDGDDLVLVLELAEGGSLLDLITARGALAPGEVVTACAPIAQALDAVHRRGLVHADVSCGNVLFTAEGRPVLSDLGVARLAGEQPSEVGVTPGFTAPEVLVGDSPGPAADIYSLAVTVRTALVGVLPDDPRAAVVKSPPLPAAPIEVIERALGAEPHNRPTAAELAEALFGIAQPRPLRLLPPKPVQPLRPDPRAAWGGGGALNGPGAGGALNGPGVGQPSPEASTHRVPRRPGPADGSEQTYVGRRARRQGGADRQPAGAGSAVGGAVGGVGLAAGAGAGAAVGGLGSGSGAGSGLAGPTAASAVGSASAARSTLDAAAAASRQNRERLGGHAPDGTPTSADTATSAAVARTHRSPRERTADDSPAMPSPPAARAAASPKRADTVAGARSASPGRSARAAAAEAGAGAGSSNGRGSSAGSGSGSGTGRSERRGAGETSPEGPGRRRDITKLVLVVVIPALLAGAALIGWQWAKNDRDAASVVSALRPVGEGKGAVSATCGGPAPAPSTPPPTPVDWTTVVRDLNEARATAFVDADPSELCDVYVPTSATLESDLELMNLYNSRGVRAQGLLFEVEKVTLVSQEAGRVVLEITDELPAYPLVDDEGETKATQPGKKSMTWRAELLPAPDGSGWRFG